MSRDAQDPATVEALALSVGADPQLARFWISRLPRLFSEGARNGRPSAGDGPLLKAVHLMLREDDLTLLDLEQLFELQGPAPFQKRAEAASQAPAPAAPRPAPSPLDADLMIDDGSVAQGARGGAQGAQAPRNRLREALEALLVVRARLEQARERI